MAKNNDIDVLDRFASAGNDAVGLINRVDDATRKFQPGQRRGSIIKAAQGNVFEFPVFISSSIPMDYATATVSLLEQMYAAYLQMAISINPVVDAASVKNGLQFADYKTDTNKYLEYTDTSYQHDACHAIYQEDGVQYEFNMLSIEDREARLINEAVDHQPLSEFDHFFQEANHHRSYYQDRVPMPAIDEVNHQLALDINGHYYPRRDGDGNMEYVTIDTLARELQNITGIARDEDGVRNVNGTPVPALEEWLNFVDANHLRIDSQADIDTASRNEDRDIAQYGTRPNMPSYEDDVDNNRRYDAARANLTEREAARANSRYYRATDAISTGARTAGDIAGAVGNTASAIYNVGTLKDRMQQEKLKTQQLRDNIAHSDEDRAIKKSDVYSKLKNKVEYVDDGKCQKLNTMKPLLMSVTVNMLNKDDSLQPINYIIGVKTHSRVIPASVLPEVARYPLKEMDKISRKIKWRAGELKFLKDLVFRINEKKQTAADSRDPNRKWYRRLYELAHMKGDAPAAAVVQGKSLFGAFIRDKQGKSKMMHGMMPNASIIMAQADVDNIKNQTEINLLKASAARAFCGELFLMSLVIIDTDAESIKVMLPEMTNDFDVHSLASVNKQLATLDTSGTKTRDMFKLLG